MGAIYVYMYYRSFTKIINNLSVCLLTGAFDNGNFDLWGIGLTRRWTWSKLCKICKRYQYLGDLSSNLELLATSRTRRLSPWPVLVQPWTMVLQGGQDESLACGDPSKAPAVSSCTWKTLADSFIPSRLDCDSAVPCGLPHRLLQPS